MLNFFLISASFFVVVYVIYTYAIKRELRKCEKVKYEYRPYVRTFTEEQTNPVSPMGLFKDMFNKPSPWINVTTQSSRLPERTIQPFTWQGLPKSEVLREGESGNFVNAFFG